MGGRGSSLDVTRWYSLYSGYFPIVMDSVNGVLPWKSNSNNTGPMCSGASLNWKQNWKQNL